MARHWRCPDHPAVREAAAGACPRCGRALEERFEPLPHGDHNPRHGGILFMCPDQFHHLEGAWTTARVFRLYFYDDFTKSISARGFQGRAILGEAGAERPLALEPAAGGESLEADLGGAKAPPLSITALILFAGKEERFDFTFDALSVEPAGDDGPSAAPGATALAGPPASGAPVPSAPAIPKSLEETAAGVLARDRQLRALIERGAWNGVYQPALEAKDLALSIEERASGWDAARRKALARAVRGLVRSAWLLDLAGDRGDGARVREEYARFAESVALLKKVFPTIEDRR
jgi:hypothetical protein